MTLRPLSAPEEVTRQTWTVLHDEAGADGVVRPSALVARAISVGAQLVRQQRLAAVSIEQLEVVRAVHTGDTLVLTGAVERETEGQVIVSIVARQGEARARAGVAALGTLRFALLHPGWAAPDSALQQTARRGAALGLTPVQARFRADAGPAALSRGGLVARVNETSLVSAQGFAGASVELEAMHALSLLAPTHAGQQLRLQCSVVQAKGTRVTVLSHLVDDQDGRDVLCALTTFRAARSVPTVKGAGHEAIMLHLAAAS